MEAIARYEVRPLPGFEALVTRQGGQPAPTMHGICRRCGRVLTDPASITIGLGPVCSSREAANAKRPHPKARPSAIPDQENQEKCTS